MKHVIINGKEYPARLTMGAMLRFRRETGFDVSTLKSDDTSGIITLIWCCVASECNAENVEFSYSLLDFADRIDPTMIGEFFKDTGGNAGASDDNSDPPTS